MATMATTLRGALLAIVPNHIKETPWGRADHITAYPCGIYCVSTSSHGGFYVPKELLPKIDPKGRADAKCWGGSENWYEEDCCWAHVAIAFPDLFDLEAVEAARRTNFSRGFGR